MAIGGVQPPGGERGLDAGSASSAHSHDARLSYRRDDGSRTGMHSLLRFLAGLALLALAFAFRAGIDTSGVTAGHVDALRSCASAPASARATQEPADAAAVPDAAAPDAAAVSDAAAASDAAARPAAADDHLAKSGVPCDAVGLLAADVATVPSVPEPGAPPAGRDAGAQAPRAPPRA
ncbi:hypothetical protein [Mangrovihabitans endophyticus]|uniref:Uncharacterized protein n=1 Tax=Mangrovihabitans endophyticus TaxID=1751298 RepID=A0A8J3BWR8_9ACTN|nr:hypothetical protein [Mangrovihabitans endophyticus]GGK84571.1 hypothetical protein GCM10012284_18610 [Mangrovihabitans endophyticus]